MTLDYGARLVAAALATYAVLSTLAAPLAVLGWHCFAARIAQARPDRQSLLLFALRLAPVGLGLLGALGAAWAFLTHESTPGAERVGLPLMVLAAASVVAVCASLWRALRSRRLTHSIVAGWGHTRAIAVDGSSVPAQCVSAPFPVVALVGVWRPRLFVARQVVDHCTPDELGAIVAHEMAHLATFDNLRRALMRCSPDVLSLHPAGRAIEAAWANAIEQAADDRAVTHARTPRLDLASALVKVARLATASPPATLPASTLFRGEPLADRVRRLIETPAAGDNRAPAGLVAAGCAAATAAAMSAVGASLAYLQGVLELAIAFGR